MDSTQWDQIRHLFHEALDRPEEERAAWLVGACPDAAVRAEVQALLDSAGDPSFLNAPAFEAVRDAIENASASFVPDASEAFAAQFIGVTIAQQYRIERAIGKGGHVIVFRAADLRIGGRPVVVKVLKEVGDHRGWLQRKFRQEIEERGGNFMGKGDIKWIPISVLKKEEGADEIVNSPDMEPYVRLAMTLKGRGGPAPNFEEIARLPLENTPASGAMR